MLLVVGNTTLDTTFRIDRLPVPGETVLAAGAVDGLGGKGANQAVTAARCGADVAFVSAVGSDAAGDLALTLLGAEPLGLDGVVRVPAPTDRSFIAVSDDGENTIISTHDAAAALDVDHVDPALAVLDFGDTVLLQGNLSAALTAHCLQVASARGARTLINPAPIQFDYGAIWPFVDCVILNAVEALTLAGTDEPVAAGRLLQAEGVGIVIVTLGADGAVMIGDGVDQIPAPDVRAVDSTGAGDVFCGVLAAAETSGTPMPSAARRAVSAASLCVTRPGAHAAIPTPAELAAIA